MKQVTVRLIDSKEYTFKVADENANAVADSVGTLRFIADDNTVYLFASNQISSQIFTECIKCPHCDKWMVPNVETISYGDNPIRFSDSAARQTERCSYCNGMVDSEAIKSHAK